MRFFLGRTAVFLVVLALALEVVFRVLIPAASAPLEYQYHNPPVMALDPGATRDGVYTVGRLARDRFHWHVNTQGFNSLHEYTSREERKKPCIAVIGSSYVQGFYSNVDSHFSASLEKLLAGRADVYNLGCSGMPLSQSTNVAAFARDRFQPDLYLVEVSNGSLKQSIRNLGFVPFARQIRFSAEGSEIVEPSAYSREHAKNLLRKSAVIRYLIYNANVNLAGGQARPAAKHADAMDKDQWRLAAAEILPQLKQAVGPVPVVLFMDGDRRAIYRDPGNALPLPESPILLEICRLNGIPFLDLTQAQTRAFKHDGKPLNFSENYHWNPHGVAVASEAVFHFLESLGWTPGADQLGSQDRPPVDLTIGTPEDL